MYRDCQPMNQFKKKILAQVCEYLRRSEESRELAIQIAVKSLHERHK
jgi:hypothetical protein